MVAITGMFGHKPRRFGLAGAETPQPAAASPLANIMQPPAQFAPQLPVRGMTPDDLATIPAMPDKKGFDWTRAIGILGDTLAGAAGGQPMYAQHLYQQKAMRERQQQQLAALADERAYREQEWTRQKQWARDNPEPRAPYRWEANDGSLMEIGPDGKPVVVYQDPTPKVNWIRADNGDGSFSMVPVGPNGPIGGAPAANGTPTAPVGKLKPYGGPTQPASGDFQR